MAFELTGWIPATITFSLMLGVLWALKYTHKSPWQTLPYPPGPPSKEIFTGNKSDMDIPFVWRKYSDWTEKYGNIIYLKMFGKSVIILNSLDDAIELFEHRSRNYSSRPVLPMYDLMGFANANTPQREYGPEWRRHRRLFQQYFKPDSVIAYRPVQTKKMHDLLQRMLTNPQDFEAHVYTYTGAIMLSVIYGYNVGPKNDPYMKLAKSTRSAFAAAPLPTWAVNTFPLLRYVPSWFPGAGFKRYANSVRQLLKDQREMPFRHAITPAALEESHVPIVSSAVSSCVTELDLKLLKEAAGSGYGAGVGTTASSILVFIVAMASYPHIQKRAQVEIDHVTGGQRLPDFNDFDSLPFIQALVRETVRWSPVSPLGIPHVCSEDDIYNGYYIPKGSIIHANVWAMSRDTSRYKDPEIFNPNRFINENGECNDEEVIYPFGFGRRLCPGRHLAISSIWLAAAVILASFDIVNQKDEEGNDLPFSVSYTDKGVSHTPYAIKCSIVPRTDRAKRIIQECRGDM